MKEHVEVTKVGTSSRAPLCLALLVASCASSGPRTVPDEAGAAPESSAPPSQVAASAPASPAQDARCPELLKVLEEVNQACPTAAPPSPAFERCAARVEEAAQGSSRAEPVENAASLVSESLRVFVDPAVARAVKDLTPIAPGEPLLDLARRRRAFSQEALRALCGIARHREQGDAWNEEAKAVFFSLQGAQATCAREGNARRAFSDEEAARLHIDVRMFVESDGRPSKVSALSPLPAMRADVALCILQTFETARFPKPEGRALVRTNVTFVRDGTP